MRIAMLVLVLAAVLAGCNRSARVLPPASERASTAIEAIAVGADEAQAAIAEARTGATEASKQVAAASRMVADVPQAKPVAKSLVSARAALASRTLPALAAADTALAEIRTAAQSGGAAVSDLAAEMEAARKKAEEAEKKANSRITLWLTVGVLGSAGVVALGIVLLAAPLVNIPFPPKVALLVLGLGVVGFIIASILLPVWGWLQAHWVAVVLTGTGVAVAAGAVAAYLWYKGWKVNIAALDEAKARLLALFPSNGEEIKKVINDTMAAFQQKAGTVWQRMVTWYRETP